MPDYTKERYRWTKPRHIRNQLRRVDKRRVLKEENYTCYYCGGVATTVDHKEPLDGWGTNARDNLCAACEPCNREKGSMNVREYAKFLARKKHEQENAPKPDSKRSRGYRPQKIALSWNV